MSTPLIDLYNLDPHVFEGVKSLPVIEIQARLRGDEPTLTLIGADLSPDRGITRITCRHRDGTDIEHDRVYLADLRVANLVPQYIATNAMIFEALLYEGSFYLNGLTPEARQDAKDADRGPYFCERCETTHRQDLPFSPPPMAIKATSVTVTVRFLDDAVRADLIAQHFGEKAGA